LSGLRVELTSLLQRVPTAEENALTSHRVLAGPRAIGQVLTSRVKGEHGAIELVLALDDKGEVKGVRLQRLREPESVAHAIQNEAWLAGFRGRTHQSGWDKNDVSQLPEQARASAEAIREGVRSLLVLQAASEGLLAKPHAHQHAP
jgi:hypothetical protein